MQDSEAEEKKIYEPYQHGIKEGTDTKRFTPLKHVQSLRRHFTKENVAAAIQYLKTKSGPAPLFTMVDTNGTWETKKDKLYWRANDQSTNQLEVVPTEEVSDFIKKSWYDQQTPSGIKSLWHHIANTHIGVSQSQIKEFVQAQKPWQMLAPKFQKGKARRTRIAGRPFAVVSIDIADMVSFAQGSGTQKGNERYILVMVDNFSSFCFAEVQTTKQSIVTLASFKKMLASIKKLGFKPPRFLRSDQGSEFVGSGWTKLQTQNGWNREFTKTYPAVRAERKIRDLKKYIRLNSYLTRGPGTMWWNVVDSSVLAVNRIYNKDKKASPTQIVKMEMQKLKGVRQNMLDSRKATQVKQKTRQMPKVGDSARISLLTEKELPRDYKGHLAYDRDGLPIRWSDKLYTIKKVYQNKETGVVRVKVDNRILFWPSQVLVVPISTVESAVWGQDGNIDYVKQRLGERHSSKQKVAKTSKSKKIKLDIDVSNIIVGKRRRKRTKT